MFSSSSRPVDSITNPLSAASSTATDRQTTDTNCPQNDCLARGTSVTMADYSEKCIEKIQIGDQVLDSLTHLPVTVTSCWYGRETKPLIQINTEHTTITCSSDHPFFCANGFIPARKLMPGHSLIHLNGRRQRIISIQETEPDEVYNLSLRHLDQTPGSAFYANRVIVGDMYVQKQITTTRIPRFVTETRVFTAPEPPLEYKTYVQELRLRCL